MDLKETLQYYRKRQGLSQIDLADALEVSRQTVSKWETGAALPSAENLLALSRLYNVPADALLNGAKAEAAPEALPLPGAAAPPAAPFRWKLVLQMLAAVLVCDAVSFLLDISVYSDGYLHFAQVFRILSCCAVGLLFAWRDRFSSVNKRTSLLLAGAALALALYLILFSTPILWQLYDLIVLYRVYPDAVFPYNPVRTFIGWTLCDELAFACHMGLIAVFQLSRLGFSRKRPFAVRLRLAPHA